MNLKKLEKNIAKYQSVAGLSDNDFGERLNLFDYTFRYSVEDFNEETPTDSDLSAIASALYITVEELLS
ncbi:MAG: hypothetical protein OCD02_11310 [Spirochaetaceae bacterium]